MPLTDLNAGGPGKTVSASEVFTDVVNAGVNTSALQVGQYEAVTFYLYNESNQSTTFQLKGSRTSAFTKDQNVGAAIVLAATTGKEVAVLTDPHVFVRWNIDPAADSTGDITIEAIGRLA